MTYQYDIDNQENGMPFSWDLIFHDNQSNIGAYEERAGTTTGTSKLNTRLFSIKKLEISFS